MATAVAAMLLMVLLAACGKGPATAPAPAAAVAASVDAAPAGATAAAGEDKPADCPAQRVLAPGLVLDRVEAPGGCLTLVRIDPRRHRLRVLTARAEGGARTAPGWVKEFGLVAATNTSMYFADERSIGLLVQGDLVNNGTDNPKLGGFLAFDPVDTADAAPVTIVGRDCPGFDLPALRARYRAVVQNYRILDCDGEAITWKDEKVFSAAAIAVDADGQLVFVHSRAPRQMSDFTALLAAPALRLQQAVYVEGGPEASLYVRAGDAIVSEVGSFETGFHDGSNQLFWPIPNVLGVTPRP